MSSLTCLENSQVFTGIAQTLLSLAPQPSPRYLLLRDVLRLPEGDNELRRARAALGDIPAGEGGIRHRWQLIRPFVIDEYVKYLQKTSYRLFVWIGRRSSNSIASIILQSQP